MLKVFIISLVFFSALKSYSFVLELPSIDSDLNTCRGESASKTCYYQDGSPIERFAPGCEISCPKDYAAKCKGAYFINCTPYEANCDCIKLQ